MLGDYLFKIPGGRGPIPDFTFADTDQQVLSVADLKRVDVRIAAQDRRINQLIEIVSDECLLVTVDIRQRADGVLPVIRQFDANLMLLLERVDRRQKRRRPVKEGKFVFDLIGANGHLVAVQPVLHDDRFRIAAFHQPAVLSTSRNDKFAAVNVAR